MAGSYAKKGSTPSKGFSSAKPSSTKRNHSILNFFQKTDTPPGATSSQARITQFVTSSRSPSSGRGTPTLARGNSSKSDTAGGLFLEDKKGLAKIEQAAVTSEASDRARSRTPENIWGEGDDFLELDDLRFNENGSSVKRQKVDLLNGSTEKEQSDSGSKLVQPARAKAASNGPFIDESDSEEDIEAYREPDEPSPAPANRHDRQRSPFKDDPARDTPVAPPPLVREATSHVEDDEFANFDDLEEEEPVGEEFRERPCEDEEQDLRFDDDDVDDSNGTDITNDTFVNACPICQKALTRLSEIVCILTLHGPLHAERQTGSRRACK